MPTSEALTAREVAARQLRERLRISVGPNARAAAEAGIPVPLSATEADDAVTIVIASLADAGMVLTYSARCSCRKTPLNYEGPERDCPVHGEPEVMLAEVTAERDGFKADLDVTRGMLGAARRHADEAKADFKERSLVAERLATRLAEHAGCGDHAESAPGRECTYCEDRSVYLAYVAAGGRDYRDGSASQGEPVSIFEVRRHTIQQGDDRE